MTTQSERAAQFRALHVPGRPLVLVNVWDAGSAKVVADSGAMALATGSWSVAAAFGYADGEHLPLDLALANLRRIVQATALPVSLDLERGYGADAAAVGATITLAVEAGAIGCNVEDSLAAGVPLRSVAEQAGRIAAMRQAASQGCPGFFINARTDVFFQHPAEAHDETLVEQALDRARAYAEAGASGLFVPGLADLRLIASLAARAPLPLNIMARPGGPGRTALAEAGVARISHGPGPYRLAMQALGDAARAAIGGAA